jgi:polar amino acid transport system substrate-binding protein
MLKIQTNKDSVNLIKAMLFAFLLASTCSLFVQATELQKAETKKGALKETTQQAIKLTIVTENLPPFQLVDENKNITGFATDVVKAVLAKTPYQYNIQLYPWSHAYNMAQKKANTCIYSIARAQQREHLFQWIGEIATTNTYFIGVKNKKVNINSLDEVKNHVTAVIRDDITHQLLIKNGFIEFKNYYVINNSDSLLKLLVSRENIDLILVDDLTMNYRIKANGFEPSLFKTYFKLNTESLKFYLACSNNTPKKIVTKLTTALELINKNGEKQKIVNKWLPNKLGNSND